MELPPLEAAHAAEVKAATADARLRVTIYAALLLILGVLSAVLYTSLKATDAAMVAASQARAQAKVNADLLKSMQLADQRRTSILENIKAANEEEARRFQALLDTVYGPGVVTLGEPAPQAPRGVPARGNGVTYNPQARPSGMASNPTRPAPAPRTTRRPTPAPVPVPLPSPTPAPLPVPQVTVRPLPLPLPLPTSLTCTSVICVK